jgi:hypothetical protein
LRSCTHCPADHIATANPGNGLVGHTPARSEVTRVWPDRRKITRIVFGGTLNG